MRLDHQGLAWNQGEEERKRLLVIAVIILSLFSGLAAYIIWVQLPEREREETEALPPQLAQLLAEKEAPPKPVVQEQEEAPKPEEPEPETETETEPEPQTAEPPKPEPTATEVEQARETASRSGILAMSDQLSQVSALAGSVQLDTPTTAVADPDPIARQREDNLAAAATTGSRSTGVDDSQLDRNADDIALAERTRGQVAESEAVAAAVESEQRAATSSETQRTREEIRLVMDANKSAIYSIYSRALRQQPSLRGSITPELIIEPNGSVSSCSIVESSLDQPALAQRICHRLQLIDFGARSGVSQTTIRYPIELFPG